MTNKTIITCAVTGGDENSIKYGNVPITPAQIATAAIEACEAGAAIAHIHVRDPQTGKPSMKLDLYREVVERIRASSSEVIINLTTGPGARFVPGPERNTVGSTSNLCTPAERVRHVLELRPEICTLDMGSLNYWDGILINSAQHIEEIANAVQSVGVKPELEIFDSGQMVLTKRMLEKGILKGRPLFQMVFGAANSAPATPQMLLTVRDLLPKDAVWAAFGVGRWEFPVLAQAFLLGGHVRVGIEDNLYLEKGVLAPSNAALVEKANRMIRELGGNAATPNEARAQLGLLPTGAVAEMA